MEIKCKVSFTLPEELMKALDITDDTPVMASIVDGRITVEILDDENDDFTEDDLFDEDDEFTEDDLCDVDDECDGDCDYCEHYCHHCGNCVLE